MTTTQSQSACLPIIETNITKKVNFRMPPEATIVYLETPKLCALVVLSLLISKIKVDRVGWAIGGEEGLVETYG